MKYVGALIVVLALATTFWLIRLSRTAEHISDSGAAAEKNSPDQSATLAEDSVRRHQSMATLDVKASGDVVAKPPIAEDAAEGASETAAVAAPPTQRYEPPKPEPTRISEHRMLELLRLVNDRDFWTLRSENDLAGALAHLERGVLAGSRSKAWFRANVLAGVVLLREASPWDALNGLVDVFSRICSDCVRPNAVPVRVGRDVWTCASSTYESSVEAALFEIYESRIFGPCRGTGGSLLSQQLVARVEDLYGRLTPSQQSDPAVHAVVEFIRLHGALTFSDDTQRVGTTSVVAERLLPRVRTFIEADRGPATERVKPMVDWIRAWYPSALTAQVETPRESTPLPPISHPPVSSMFVCGS